MPTGTALVPLDFSGFMLPSCARITQAKAYHYQ